jgi:hypothetical protein
MPIEKRASEGRKRRSIMLKAIIEARRTNSKTTTSSPSS